ncbi:MAG TPA: hypothetical protein VKZ89_00605 [Thermobifida alba]|nr:hypothetical protein [Thermobifida alba]
MPQPKKPPEKRRRANVAPSAMELPREGRSGPPPKWPLPKPTAAERRLWAELWATPQACAWESLGWTRTVARYARKLLDAEKDDAPVALLSEVRQLEDRLGLTPLSLLRLEWRISDATRDEVEARPAAVVVTPERWRRVGAG